MPVKNFSNFLNYSLPMVIVCSTSLSTAGVGAFHIVQAGQGKSLAMFAGGIAVYGAYMARALYSAHKVSTSEDSHKDNSDPPLDQETKWRENMSKSDPPERGL